MRLSIAKNDTKEIKVYIDGEEKVLTVASFVSPEVRKAQAEYTEEKEFHHVLAASVIDWDLEEDLAECIKDYDALANLIYSAAIEVTKEIAESKKP